MEFRKKLILYTLFDYHASSFEIYDFKTLKVKQETDENFKNVPKKRSSDSLEYVACSLDDLEVPFCLAVSVLFHIFSN